MLRTTIILTILVFGALGLSAQDDVAQYQTWMKAAAGASRAVRGAITAKDNAAVATQAKTLEENFGNIADFWTKKSKPEAAAFATTARDAAKALGAATTPEDQTAAAQKLNGTCMGCHAIARDGDKFKM
jgi:hypothetical protein